MKFSIYSFKNSLAILSYESMGKQLLREIQSSIGDIDDADIISAFEKSTRKSKSISHVLTNLIDYNFKSYGWKCNEIFFEETDLYDSIYNNKRWSLDYFKEFIGVEIGFKHEDTIAWNLAKISIASNPNAIKKKYSIQLGVIISVTQEMKSSGGFDHSIATYEKYKEYLNAFSAILDTPILIIGIEAPSEFGITHLIESNRRLGEIVKK